MRSRYRSLRRFIKRIFKIVRTRIESFPPSLVRRILLTSLSPLEKGLVKYVVCWQRHYLKVGLFAACLLLLSVLHSYLKRDLDPYVTYERLPDGKWMVHEEYRVVESPYVYSPVKVPGCRTNPTVAGESLKISHAAVQAPTFVSALSPLKSLEISQIFFSYYFPGSLGKLLYFDKDKLDVASCRVIFAWLPRGAKPAADDLLALTTIDTTESSPSTVNCDAYKWHQLAIERIDPPCGYEYVEKPDLIVVNGQTVGVKARFRNWLQDQGVDRCVQISTPFIPAVGWSPPAPSGTICRPFITEDVPNLPLGII